MEFDRLTMAVKAGESSDGMLGLARAELLVTALRSTIDIIVAGRRSWVEAANGAESRCPPDLLSGQDDKDVRPAVS